ARRGRRGNARAASELLRVVLWGRDGAAVVVGFGELPAAVAEPFAFWPRQHGREFGEQLVGVERLHQERVDPGLPREHPVPRGRLAAVDGVEQVHGDIADTDFVLVLALTLHTVVDHDVTERARGGDAGRAGGEEFLRARIVHLLADALLHPHPRAAGATAH